MFFHLLCLFCVGVDSLSCLGEEAGVGGVVLYVREGLGSWFGEDGSCFRGAGCLSWVFQFFYRWLSLERSNCTGVISVVGAHTVDKLRLYNASSNFFVYPSF